MGDPIRLYILKETVRVIKEENLVDRCAKVGDQLLKGLEELASLYPGVVENARGRGLMCSFDVVGNGKRDLLRSKMLNKGKFCILCFVLNFYYRHNIFSCYYSNRILLNDLDICKY